MTYFPLSVSLSEGVRDNWGKEFILAFTQYGPTALKNTTQAEITGEPNVKIKLTFSNIQQSISMTKKVKTVYIPSSYSKFNEMEPKGISISSTSSVSVRGISKRPDISAGFICIPVERLSASYVVVTYLPDPSCQTFFSIVSKDDHTKVTITLRLAKKDLDCHGFKHGSKKTINMNKLSVYGIKCSSDVTGSTISSNKVVAVMVGSMCQTGTFVNLVEKMMLPKSLFGWSYVLPVYPVVKSLYRIYAPKAGTKLSSSTGKRWGNILDKEPIDIVLDVDKPLCISSTKPMYVLVVLKPIETNGRQLHTIHQVPSSSQYLQQYTVNLAGKSQYFLTVIVHEDVVDLLSQAVGELYDPKVFTHDIESCSMKTFTKVHDASGLLHLNSTVPFGLIVHSMTDDVASGLEPGMLMGKHVYAKSVSAGLRGVTPAIILKHRLQLMWCLNRFVYQRNGGTSGQKLS